ncbi:MAG TPA: hypothetical protein VGN28_16615 [Blastococcus sp.]|nr:hypothetical protein [Blastococcus sp.]
MATGRIRRSARRGVAAAALGWLGVAALSVLMAPSAQAASTYTVHIKDLTPPIASVDKGGKVTFIDEIPDKTIQVGGGGLLPSLVSVTARTAVTLTLPSGDHKLLPTSVPTNPPTTPPTTSVFTEAFSTTCATCTITYSYELSSGSALTSTLTAAALKALPPLPVPTPFVVNTLIALPNLPGVNLPTLPPVTVPKPSLPSVPGGVTLPKPGATGGQPSTGGSTVQGIPGDVYAYNTGSGAPQLRPGDTVAASAFDPARYFGSSGSSNAAGTVGSDSSSGSGGRPGSYDGASVPVFGKLAGLDGRKLAEDGAQKSASGAAAQTLPVAALAAVVALAAVTAALVRTHQAARASR